MTHLTPAQFVDIAEGAQPESSVPHLATCERCRRELNELRAVMADTDVSGRDAVMEPSPLFWNELSARVRNAVAEERARPQSLLEWLRQPRVFVASLASAFAVLLIALLMPRTDDATIPARPLPLAQNASLPSASPSLPPLAPLGLADDPHLRIVASVATSVDWDEMRDEVAFANTGTSDAVAASLTIDEQRELRRLLVEETAQPGTLEKRS